MAGRSYGGRRESWRERGSSIFSDDDDDRRGPGGVREEERGFFERAGDEVRSWFGDQEAERRRERDLRRDEAGSAFGEIEEGRDPRRIGGRAAYRRNGGWEGSGHGARPVFNRDSLSPGGESFSGDTQEFGRGRFDRGGNLGSRWDDNYLRWRALQIEQFDREYDDYCRERQNTFEQEFDSWRTSRLTRGGAAGNPAGMAGMGQVDVTAASGDAGAATRSLGTESAVASSELGGTASGTGEDVSPATRGRSRTRN